VCKKYQVERSGRTRVILSAVQSCRAESKDLCFLCDTTSLKNSFLTPRIITGKSPRPGDHRKAIEKLREALDTQPDFKSAQQMLDSFSEGDS